MAMMLRHKPTGDVYIYTTLLAEREDMEVIESGPDNVKIQAPSLAESAKLKPSPSPAKKSVGANP